MKWYPWLQTSYCKILASYQQNHGHHALLIHSSRGNGEISLCYAISRWLMCQQPDGIKSCGICHNCRLMIAGNHPDFYQLVPTKPYQPIGIDGVRDIINRLSGRSRHNHVKIIWVIYSDLLTTQAAHALLKTLEEPPADTYFLLCCHNLARLLPTFKSRCLYWLLPLPDETHSIYWLQQKYNYHSHIIRTALRIVGGAPLEAEILLQSTRWQERQILCTSLTNALNSRNMLSLLPILKRDNDDGPWHWLLTLISDAVKWQYGAKEFVINNDQLPLVQKVAVCHTTIMLYAQWQQWLHCRQQKQEINSINYDLLLTNYLLDWENSLN